MVSVYRHIIVNNKAVLISDMTFLDDIRIW